MQQIGCHIDAKKYNNLVDVALNLNTNTMQFFSRSAYGGPIKVLDIDDIKEFNKKLKENNFENILIHAPFIINGSSDKENIRISSPEIIREDLERVDMFGVNTFYVFHPGNHMKQGSGVGCKLIAEMLDKVNLDTFKTTVLLETMAGKGTELGKTFEELALIIKSCKHGERLGVCLDTCHIWDGGYDLTNLDSVLDEFDRIIGLDKLKFIHLNNSLNICGAHKDRHANIDDGKIPLDVFKAIMTNKRLENIPKILETPVDKYESDLTILKSFK